ncbi:RHS repeat-associated core domain-containing protein, partial [Candidatus Omnitrophota bacterium]
YNNNYRFTGQLFDSTSNLYYYGARYYDPEIGRFITADPTIQHPNDPQDFNRYAYCRNNPLRYTDPTGYGFWDSIKGFFGKIVGAVAGVVAFATTGNPILAFAAFNSADAIASGAQAIASGANPGVVIAAAGLSIGLNKAIPFHNYGNLGMQIAYGATRGAFISTATTAMMQGGGKLGPAAAWGGGMGAMGGFLSSQQFQNWQVGNGFASNQQVEELNNFAGRADPERTVWRKFDNYYQKSFGSVINLGKVSVAPSGGSGQSFTNPLDLTIRYSPYRCGLRTPFTMMSLYARALLNEQITPEVVGVGTGLVATLATENVPVGTFVYGVTKAAVSEALGGEYDIPIPRSYIGIPWNPKPAY